MSKNRFDESGYQRSLRDSRWQKRRLEILSSANWKCQDAGCPYPTRTLEVHHLYYVRGRDPWDYPDDAFLALCSDCHEKRQTVERSLKVEIMKRLKFVPISRLEKLAWEMIEKALEVTQ